MRALGGEADWAAEGINGWRFLRLHAAEWPTDDRVQAVAQEVAGPLMCAYILDSDFAQVRLAAPGRDLFEFVLNQTSAGNYDYPVDAQVQGAVPARIQAWAEDIPDLAAVAGALATEMVFAEDAVLRLAAAIGAIPAEDLKEWAFGPLEGTD